MNARPGYLVRYGLMGHVGRFAGPVGAGDRLGRGQVVVLRTDRGVELGEVLLWLDDDGSWQDQQGQGNIPQRILRLAGADDWRSHQCGEPLRFERFSICRRILDEAGSGLELLDLELLLDQQTTVLHVLGSGSLDLALIRARIRSQTDFDVLFEPLGPEGGLGVPERNVPAAAGAGRCGDCDCGDGGCGASGRRATDVASASRLPEEPTQDASDASATVHSACASCGISRWMAEKRGAGV